MSKSKEFSVTFTVEESSNIQQLAFQRGVKPSDVIREHFRRGISQICNDAVPANNELVPAIQEIKEQMVILSGEVAGIRKHIECVRSQMTQQQGWMSVVKRLGEANFTMLEVLCRDTSSAEVREKRHKIIEHMRQDIEGLESELMEELEE